MMWQEFERIAGYEVSYEDYTKIIEPMYNATELTKQEFVKVLNRKQFDLKYKREKLVRTPLLNEMRCLAREMQALCGRCTTYEVWEELKEIAKRYVEEFPEWLAPHHELETAKGYGNCTYVTALVYYDKDWNEVKRIELVD